jgi:hypothetical protein
MGRLRRKEQRRTMTASSSIGILALLFTIQTVGGFLPRPRMPHPVVSWKPSKTTTNKGIMLWGERDDNNIRENSLRDPSEDSFPSLITQDPGRSLAFSGIMALCGAALGPFLDSCKYSCMAPEILK